MGWFDRWFRPKTPAETPRKSEIRVHEACGGAIRVFGVPTDPAWQSGEDQREGDGYVVQVLRYILPDQPSPLALLAKVYTLDDGAPEDPGDTDWRASLGGLFDTIDDVATVPCTQTTMRSSLPAVEATVRGVGTEGEARVIRERRAVLANEQFLVTAIGTPAQFEAHAEAIDGWFENAAFLPLAEDA